MKKLAPYIDQILVSGTIFLINVLLVRELTLLEYGYFSIAWFILLFLSNFHHSLIVSGVLSLGPKLRNKHRYFNVMFYINIIFICFIIFLFFLINLILEFTEVRYSYINYNLLFLLCSYIIYDFLRRYFYANNDIKSALKIDISTNTTIISLFIFQYFYNDITLNSSFKNLAVGYLIGSFITISCFKFINIKLNFSKYIIKRHWFSTKWNVATALLIWVSSNYYILISGYILGAWAIGIIKMCQNIVGIFTILFQVLENTLAVDIAHNIKKLNKNTFKKYILNKLYLYESIIIIIITITSIFSEHLLSFLYGDEYKKYNYLLILYLSLNVFILINMSLKFIIRSLENTKVLFNSYLISAIVSLITSYPLIKYFELYGVIIGLIISQTIIIIFSFTKVRRSL